MCDSNYKLIDLLAVDCNEAEKLSWWEGRNLFLRCFIQTNAKTTEFVGQHDDRLKIRLAAEPIDGKANGELLKFIAMEFGVPRSRVSLVKGSQSKLKLVKVEEPKAQAVIIGKK